MSDRTTAESAGTDELVRGINRQWVEALMAAQTSPLAIRCYAKAAYLADPEHAPYNNPCNLLCQRISAPDYVKGNPLYDHLRGWKKATYESTPLFVLSYFFGNSDRNPEGTSEERRFNNLYEGVSGEVSLLDTDSPIRIWDTPMPLFEGDFNSFANSPVEIWHPDLPKFREGNCTFRNSALKDWQGELPLLRFAFSMFRDSKLTRWYKNLPQLQLGISMFRNTPLTFFGGDLPCLRNGYAMFQGSNIQNWSTDMPKLVNGRRMFKDTPLIQWTARQLFNLTTAEQMFYGTRLVTWNTPTPNLRIGRMMFANSEVQEPDRPASLERFRGSLPSLVDGRGMFTNCRLDVRSVEVIADTVNNLADEEGDPSENEHGHLDLSVKRGVETTERFAEALKRITAKGWDVTVASID